MFVACKSMKESISDGSRKPDLQIRIAYWNLKYIGSPYEINFLVLAEDIYLRIHQEGKKSCEVKKIMMILPLKQVVNYEPNNKSSIFASNKNLDVSFVVHEKFRIYLIQSFNIYENPIILTEFENLQIEMKSKVLQFSTKLRASLKPYLRPCFESFIEELDFKLRVALTKEDDNEIFMVSNETNRAFINFKLEIAESLVQTFRMTNEVNADSKLYDLLIHNKLGKEFVFQYNSEEYHVNTDVLDIPLVQSRVSLDEKVNFWEWLISTADEKTSFLFGKFIKNLHDLEAHYHIRYMTFDEGKIKPGPNQNNLPSIQLSHWTFSVPLKKEGIFAVEMFKNSPYRLLIENNFSVGGHCIYVRTNTRLRNSTNMKLTFIFYKKNIVKKRSFSSGNLQEPVKPYFSSIFVCKLKPEEEIDLPFFEKPDETYISITVGSSKTEDFKYGPSISSLLHKTMGYFKFNDSVKNRHFFFVASIKSIPVPLVDNNASSTFVLREDKEDKPAPQDNICHRYVINIEPPIKIKNNLNFELKLFFKPETNLTVGNSTIHSDHVSSNKPPPSLAIDMAKFSEKLAYNFLVMEHNLLYINKEKGCDYVKLKRKLKMALDIAETATSLKIQQSEPENFNETRIVQIHCGGETPMNVLLRIKHKSHQIKLLFSSEFLLMNEIALDLKLTIKETDYEYDKIELSTKRPSTKKQEFVEKNDHTALISLEEHINDVNCLPILKEASSNFVSFTGNLDASSKVFVIESSDTKIEVNLADFLKQKQKRLLYIDRQTVYMDLIPTDKRIALNGLIIFYYPFFIVNKSNEDFVIKVKNFSDKILILTKLTIFSSQDLLPAKKYLSNTEFVLKINSNDYEWSSGFPLFVNESNLPKGKYFLKIRHKQDRMNDKTYTIEVKLTSFARIIEIYECQSPCFRIENNLDKPIWICQKEDKGSYPEIILSKVSREFFWTNSLSSTDLIFFRKNYGSTLKLTKICDIDHKSYQESMIIHDAELKTFEITVDRDDNAVTIKLTPTHDKESLSNIRSTGRKIQKLLRETLNYNNYIPYKLVGQKSHAEEHIPQRFLQVEFSVFYILLSFCDNQPREIMLLGMKNLNIAFSNKIKEEKLAKELAIRCEDIQLDSQYNYFLHNVNLLELLGHG